MRHMGWQQEQTGRGSDKEEEIKKVTAPTNKLIPNEETEIDISIRKIANVGSTQLAEIPVKSPPKRGGSHMKRTK